MKIFWGDSHQNTYTAGTQIPSMMETLAFARTHLDFYSGAYYTALAEPVPILPAYTNTEMPEWGGHISEQPTDIPSVWQGIKAERTKDAATLDREWAEFQEATATHNTPGEFVTFPGYEWQGNGAWGDHNVIYKQEGYPLIAVMDLPTLYKILRTLPALAIPHHTAYHPGIRAPYWRYTDETLSPYSEIYSIHGCSETDEAWVGMRQNPHMGPAMEASTYQSALNKGLHLGAICSTDNWTQMPGRWGHGLMAAVTKDLTRESLWDAFNSRRVYGVTGDRIELLLSCNDMPMGSILPYTDVRNFHIQVKCLDALDRIELLRNGRVIATYNHQEQWQPPSDQQKTRFITRLEVGWGPRMGELPFYQREWTGQVTLSQGRFLNWWPCWTHRGQSIPALQGKSATFVMQSYQHAIGQPFQQGIVLEYEADPLAILTLHLNGQVYQQEIRNMMKGSDILWYRDECLEMIKNMTGSNPEGFQRQDPLFYHYAFKAKVHRTIPEVGYSAIFDCVDTDKLEHETNYRIRVEQRNGQRAWSSPIWVKAKK